MKEKKKKKWKENSSRRCKRRLKNKKEGKDIQKKVLLACIVYYIPLFFSSLFVQMAENYRLQDTLLIELSDVNLFCKLIKYPAIRDNMLKTFKVRVSLCKSADLDSHKCFFTTSPLQSCRAHSENLFFIFPAVVCFFTTLAKHSWERENHFSIFFPFLSPTKKNQQKNLGYF